MAMLAEKRFKTRYNVGLNFRKALKEKFTGDSGFGLRMLEKMGWSSGNGLGAKEDGEVDPIFLKMKSDNKGLGFMGTSEDIAVAQQQDFDALLATFAQEAGEKTEDSNAAVEAEAPEINTPKSLEQMSKKSRARVHYQKFTRGKDLSRASSKDLASILGMAIDGNSPKPAAAEPETVPNVGPPIASRETTFGITSYGNANINDYFKRKYEEKKRKLEASECADGSKRSKILDDTDSSNLVVRDEMEENASPVGENNVNSDNSKKKKKKKKDKSSENGDFQANTSILNSTMNEEDNSSSKGRRKSVTWGDVEVSFVSKYIKDMVDTSGESVNGDLSSETIESNEETATVESEKKKKKKKSKKDREVNQEDKTAEGVESNDVNITSDQHPISTISQDSSDLSNKKKKKKKNTVTEETSVSDSQDVVSNETLDCETIDIGSDSDRKKKKKKKKMAIEVATSDSEPVILSCAGTVENSEVSVSKKKRKKSENILDEELSGSSQDARAPSEESVTLSKKKRKRSEEDESPVQNEPEERTPEKKKKTKRKDTHETDETSENTINAVDECIVNTTEISEDGRQEKKKKKRKCTPSNDEGSGEDKSVSNIEETNTLVASDSISGEVSKKEKKKKKKKKHDDFLSIATGESNDVVNCNEAQDESNSSTSNDHPALSALTQERMAKWKNRKGGKDKSKEKTVEGPVNDKTSPTTKLTYTPSKSHVEQEIRDYDHRRVFVALGYDVKKAAVNNTITIDMPPTDFPGSNLDEIPGYGRSIKPVRSC